MKVIPYVDDAAKWHKLIKASREGKVTAQVGHGRNRAKWISVNAIEPEPVKITSPMQAVVERAEAQIEREKEESRDAVSGYKRKLTRTPALNNQNPKKKKKKKVPKSSPVKKQYKLWPTK